MDLTSASNKSTSEICSSIASQFDGDYWPEHCDNREFPSELWAALGAAGLLGTLVPESEGGLGRNLSDMVHLTEDLARLGFPMLTLITGPGLALPALANAGSLPLRRDLLPDLLAGRAVLPFAITESKVGSDILGLTTQITQEGDSYRLAGEKNYTSLADIADHVMVLARSDGPDPKRSGFTLAVVPMNAAGIERRSIETRIPMPERQSTIRFDDVVLSRGHLVGEPGQALAILAPALVAERLISAALSCGLGTNSLARATEYVKTRSVRGRPLATHQGVQHPLARAHVHLHAARLLLYEASKQADAGKDSLGIANMALFAAGEAGLEATEAALQVHGGYGFTREAGIISNSHMARLLRAAPVHAEGALNGVAEAALGLPPSS